MSEYHAPAQTAEEKLVSTEKFLAELKRVRTFTIIKTVVIIAIVTAACLIFTHSLWVTIALVTLFVLIKKFVNIGASITYDYFDTHTLSYQIGDYSVLGFLIGIVIIYAVCTGLVKLDAMLFPPYFFVFDAIILTGVGLWFLFPILRDIYTIAYTSILIKNPPQTPYFKQSEYEQTEKLVKFKKAIRTVVTTLCICAVAGVLIVQGVQYAIQSPRLLAELDREALYTEYAKTGNYTKIPSAEFANPDNREYKRFKARCVDQYDFESDNDGLKSKNTVTVTYNYEEIDGWTITDYTANMEILSMDMHGTWSGKGKDGFGYDSTDQSSITLKIDTFTETAVSGTFVCKNSAGELIHESPFTGTVEKKESYDDANKSYTFYVEATFTTPRPIYIGHQETFKFYYQAESDTMIFEKGYVATLLRE